LCVLVRAEPQFTTTPSTSSGKATAQWYACCAPMDQPYTQRSRSIPQTSRSRRRWAETLSQAVTRPGQRSGALLGEVDRPLPNMFGTTTNHRPGSSTPSGPISHSVSVCCAE
jgi:hypothetical protein